MSVISGLYNGTATYNFPRWWRATRLVSIVLVVISLASLIFSGLNLGIDFEGGSSWEVRAPGVSVNEARDVLRPFGEAEAKIQVVDGDVLRIQAPVKDPVRAGEISTALSELGEFLGLNSVGPSWGKEITKQAVQALVVFFILLAIFIAWRLEWRMAIGALVAVIHDLVISVGIYSVLGLSITPATVVAFLTILGYSLYDTIVVFDKVHELSSRPALATKNSYTDIMNTALNQVLMRSINTTLVALFPVIAMLIVGRAQGADTLIEFAVALFIGLLVGAYSSLFVAAPVVAWIKERDPKSAAAKRRSGSGTAGARIDTRETVVAGAPAAASKGAAVPGAATTPKPPGSDGVVIPPRPRKKKRR